MKKFVFIILCAFLIIGCNNLSYTELKLRQEQEQIIRAFFNDFEKEDYEAMRSHCWPNFQINYYNKDNVWGLKSASLIEFDHDKDMNIADNESWIYTKISINPIEDSMVNSNTDISIYVVLKNIKGIWAVERLELSD